MNAADSSEPCATRARILEAAGEEFAANGYRNTTVRSICERAQANVASINYHFGDKQRLYGEVLRFGHMCACESHPMEGALTQNASPEQHLREFIQVFVARIFDAGRPAWHGKLISREMAEPTHALQELVEASIRPSFLTLMKIVSAFIGDDISEREQRFYATSIIAQCVHYHNARGLIEHLFEDHKWGEHFTKELIEHVTRFSLAALQERAGEYPRKPI